MKLRAKKGTEISSRQIILFPFFLSAAVAVVGLAFTSRRTATGLRPEPNEDYHGDFDLGGDLHKPTSSPVRNATSSSSAKIDPFTENDDLRKRMLTLLSKEQRADLEEFGRQRDSAGRAKCHTIMDHMEDTPSIPIPQSWFDSCEATREGSESGRKPIYIFVMGKPYSGTSATLGLIVAAPEVANLCKLREGKPPDCEGVKHLASPGMNAWKPDWPIDFQTDVIQRYESMWSDKSKCVRVDKSLPYSVKVGQMIDQLVERDDMHVAFLFMTRSFCSKDRIDTGLPLSKLAESYQFLLDKGIPVIHLRYEDYFADLNHVEQRLNQWAGGFKVDSTLGYTHITPEAEEIMDTHLRIKPLRDFVAEHPLSTLQRNATIRFSEIQLTSLAYFGYTLRPVTA
eukprot:Plantae.Rhodophyta-Purpureofilum_apyrenoidigerum.ctg22587.p1 GENE.Plantae.Rhodophyta-Purpureofilum_apyrenoidigerum.ctg22587~~Plantae.Rhodophyta-Purpureofilum_apyrenoidigerum.ctg22587.p1  ORF type:complete len:415 (-),score=53.09 Plantae.Rhodophyta-Purpureofilum_apyrenoidigerum.ctg22587:129-1319(-)